jgi:hypothetical protein
MDRSPYNFSPMDFVNSIARVSAMRPLRQHGGRPHLLAGQRFIFDSAAV